MTMNKRSVFKFEKRERWQSPRPPEYKTLATFPSFKLAWDNANNMFSDGEYDIIACHLDPGDSVNSPEAGFMVGIANTLEEYRISELLGDNDNE